MYSLLDRALAAAAERGPVRRRRIRRDARTGNADVARPDPRRQPARRRDRGRRCGRARACSGRSARRCWSRSSVERRAQRPLRGDAAVPRAAARRAAHAASSSCRRGRRCWRATAPRWRRAPGAPRRFRASPGRSSGCSVRSRPTRPSTYEAEGYPPNAKVGQDGLERVFERQLAGTPGGDAARRQAGAGGRAADPRDDRQDDDRSGDRVAPRSARSAGATAGSSRWTPATGSCWRSPGSPSRRSSRPARR